MRDLLQEVSKKYSGRMTTKEQIESGLAILDRAGVLDAATDWAKASGIAVEDLALSLHVGPLCRRSSDTPDTASRHDYLDDIASNIRRIADHLAPIPTAKVGTTYIAEKLDCTTVWVTEMIRNGKLPANCIVPGTGNGKPWKFFRARIDGWLASR
jgi:hypothetical protein